jgi:hypothetical protein
MYSKKADIIAKYGEDYYNKRLAKQRDWNRRRICKEYWKIENYELAKADNFEGWEIHHRLEISLDNEEVHSLKSLKRLGMYYDRPYFELIFLTTSEHTALHMNARDTTGVNNSMHGKHPIPWNKGLRIKKDPKEVP